MGARIIEVVKNPKGAGEEMLGYFFWKGISFGKWKDKYER